MPVLGALAVLRLAPSYTGRLRQPARPRAIARPTRPSSRPGLRPSPRANWRRFRWRASLGEPIDIAFERDGGGKLTLADFKGRAVLLNLWATWCMPCRAEMPALDRLQAAKGGPGFEVVAVNVDTARLEKRAAFLDSVGVKSLARYSDLERRRLRDPAQGRQGAWTAGDPGHRQGRLRTRRCRRRRQMGFSRGEGADRDAQGRVGGGVQSDVGSRA